MRAELKKYWTKRDFKKTPEPKGGKPKKFEQPVFVVQKHQARNLHYDFRLEIDGVLKSWAIPKGPSLNPQDKRLAIPTEDHPREYADFEGVIPEGEYGAGVVLVWDRGTYQNLSKKDGKLVPMQHCWEDGAIEIFLGGKKLKGGFALRRFRRGAKDLWLLIKMRDRYIDEQEDVLVSKPNSVLSGRSLEEIEK